MKQIEVTVTLEDWHKGRRELDTHTTGGQPYNACCAVAQAIRRAIGDKWPVRVIVCEALVFVHPQHYFMGKPLDTPLDQSQREFIRAFDTWQEFPGEITLTVNVPEDTDATGE